jgi:hypothetical protein
MKKFPTRGTTCVKIASLNEGSSEAHNDRELELDYLLPEELRQENSTWKEKSVAEKRLEIEQRYREHTHQKMQAKSRIFREGILLFDDQTTFDEIKECCKALDERFGFKIFQIHAHRDEGFIDAETGKVKYNLHAHLTIDWTNQATGINLQGHRVKKKTESNAKNKELHRAKFLERIGTDEETVANNKKKMTKSARAKLEKKQTPIVFDPNDPSNEWHLKQSEKYDYFKMGLFDEDFALMQDVASEALKMNRGQVKGKKGIEIQAWKALKAREKHDKKMILMDMELSLKQTELETMKEVERRMDNAGVNRTFKDGASKIHRFDFFDRMTMYLGNRLVELYDYTRVNTKEMFEKAYAFYNWDEKKVKINVSFEAAQRQILKDTPVKEKEMQSIKTTVAKTIAQKPKNQQKM